METKFVYKWTHLPTGRWYIGSRTNKKAHPDDGYICSSVIVKPLIQTSPSEWEREILHFGSAKEMRQKESQLLRLYDAANNPMSFNRSNLGGSLENAGRKKGSGIKLKGKVILDAINKICMTEFNTDFVGTIIENYAQALKNKDNQIIEAYDSIFFKKQMIIRLNGQKIYDYKDYL
jgi:hypothetical protein